MERASLIRRVLHPSDFSGSSDEAFVHALKFALAGGCSLTIVHTGRNAEDNAAERFPRVRRTLERWGVLPLNSASNAIPELGLSIEKVVLNESNTVRSLIHFLSDSPHDLIVLTTHQYDGLERWTHEAIAEPLARKANAMTLFIPREGGGFVSSDSGALLLESVLVPVNRVPDPQFAVNAAAAVVGSLGCSGVEATLLYVGDRAEAPAIHFPDGPALKWRWMFREGDVEDEILRAAQEYSVNLIVMGTEGHRNVLDVLRGDTTEHVVRHAKCPVLAVPVLRQDLQESLLASLATGQTTI